MIKINKKDSIIDIIIKIKNCKKNEIVLDFPFGHPIIHSYISLKILKNKSENKELIIITSDKSAKKIGSRLGIKYSQIGDIDLLEYNYSFFEYSKYLIKRYIQEISIIFSNKKNNITFDYQKQYGVINGKIGFFLIGLISSIFLFIFIFYFAVNKTYIYITPEITVKAKSANFIFKEKTNEEEIKNNIIEIKKVSKLIYITKKFGTSGIDENTLKKSSGKVKFYNHLEENIGLLKNTRLKTKDGILFITNTQVNIPKAIKSSTGVIIPGTININITSKIHDLKGNIIGNKANINSGTLLSLPGLKENTNEIYAKTIGNIKGANNNYKKLLTEIDIKNSKKIIESELKQKSLNQLKKEILDKDNNYKILGIDNIIEYSDFKIIGEDKLKIGDNINTFELSGTIKINSYIYNTQKIINKLSTIIKATTLDDIEKVLFLNDDSLRIANIINKKEKPLEIKATAQIEAFFSHNFLTKKNNYINKLKNIISGVDKNEALKILLNNSNISDVKIDIRPFFINTVSKINENIIIKVVDK